VIRAEPAKRYHFISRTNARETVSIQNSHDNCCAEMAKRQRTPKSFCGDLPSIRFELQYAIGPHADPGNGC
jgi:hypothetical protein